MGKKIKISSLLMEAIRYNQIPSYKEDLKNLAIKNGFTEAHVRNFFNSFASRGKLVNLGDRVQDMDGFIDRTSEDIDILTCRAVEICSTSSIKQTDAMWIKSQLDKETEESKDYDKHEIKEILKASGRFTVPNNFNLVCEELEGFEYSEIGELLSEVLAEQTLPVSSSKISELLYKHGREYGAQTLHSYILADKNGLFDKWGNGFYLHSRKNEIEPVVSHLQHKNRDELFDFFMRENNVTSLTELSKKLDIKWGNFFFKDKEGAQKFVIKLADRGMFERKITLCWKVF